MGNCVPPTNKSSRTVPSMFPDDDGFATDVNDDVIRILEENARLRALVTQLSGLVLKHVADQK